MAINDLLDPDSPEWRREAERLRRERMPPRPGQAQPRPALDPVARAAANRVRFPTDTGTLGASGERVFGDAAARTAAPSASVQSAPQPGRIGRMFSPATRGAAGAMARTFGRAAGPAAVIGIEALDAAPTLADPRATGMDKAAKVAEGVGRGASTLTGAALGASAGSVVPVVGTALGGIAGGLAGYYLGDKAIEAGRALTGSSPYEAPSLLSGQRAAQASQQPVAATPAAQQQAPQPQAAQPQIYRRGNEFSDQAISGGAEFQPRRGGVSVIPADREQNRRFLEEGSAERERQLQRRDASIDAEIARANRSSALRSAQADARSAAMRADSLLSSKVSGRTRRELQLAALDAAQQATALEAEPLPEPRAVPSLGESRGQLATARSMEEQAIGAGLQNQAAQRQQQVIDQFGQLPADDPRRRQLIDRALVGAGKDPEAGRYQAIETIAGVDALGVPVTTRSLFDTRTGQIINSGNSGGIEPPANHIAALKSNPKLAEQFDEKYGKGAAARYLGQ